MTKVLRGWIAAGLAGLVCFGGALPAYAQTSPSAYTSATRYDLMNRVVGTILPDPDAAGAIKYAAVRNTYDAAGRLTKVESGELGVWKSEAIAPSAWGSDFSVFKTIDTVYDALDRKVKETVTGHGPPVTQTVTQYSYDIVGRLECTAVRMNPAIYGSLPASACTPGTEGGDGADRISRNVYDDAGQLVQLREGVGSSIEAAEATWSYSNNGKKRYVIDGEGNRAELTYDGHDRQEKWIFPSTTRPTAFNGATPATAVATAGSVNSSDHEQYGYDLNGNRTSLRKRDGSTLTYSYDNLDRVTVKVVPERAGLTTAQTRDVYYEYDVYGRMTKARFDSLSGEGIANGYNGFGELTSSTITISGLSAVLGYGYDKESNRTRLTHPDGVYFTLGRDGLNRVKDASWTTGAGTTTFLGIGYERTGLRSSIVRGASSTTYGYDGAYRLSALAQNFAGTVGNAFSTFGYNPASQIANETRDNDAYAWTGAVTVNRAYTTNGLNQYSQAGPASFCYDPNGNLTADGSSVYKYDVENRLIEKRAQVAGPCPTDTTGYTGTLQASLSYDPLGRLWQVIGPTTNTRFLYDGSELVAEYDSAGTLAWRYFFGPNVDEPILADAGGQMNCVNTRFLHLNHQGSMIAAVDCGGNRTAVGTYDEYGIPGASNWGRFQYTGQAWLPELGMYHYKARLYSPTLGRFLQTDPVGYDDQINLYAYVANDPVNKTDPNGLYECPECSKKEAKTVAAFVKGIQAAAKAKNASEGLKAAATALGTKNDGGIAVNFGKLDQGTLGQFNGDSITLDKVQIYTTAERVASASGSGITKALFAVGSGVVAHEGSHYAQKNTWSGRPAGRMADERQAYRVQDETMQRLGVSHRFMTRDSNQIRSVRSCAQSLAGNGMSQETAEATCANY